MTRKVQIQYVDTWEFTTEVEIPDGMSTKEFAKDFLEKEDYFTEKFERVNMQVQTRDLDTGETESLQDIDV
jgi:hypothetical protein